MNASRDVVSSVDTHHAAVAVTDTTDAPGVRGSVDAHRVADAVTDTTDAPGARGSVDAHVAAASMHIMLSRQEANRQWRRWRTSATSTSPTPTAAKSSGAASCKTSTHAAKGSGTATCQRSVAYQRFPSPPASCRSCPDHPQVRLNTTATFEPKVLADAYKTNAT